MSKRPAESAPISPPPIKRHMDGSHPSYSKLDVKGSANGHADRHVPARASSTHRERCPSSPGEKGTFFTNNGGSGDLARHSSPMQKRSVNNVNDSSSLRQATSSSRSSLLTSQNQSTLTSDISPVSNMDQSHQFEDESTGKTKTDGTPACASSPKSTENVITKKSLVDSVPDSIKRQPHIFISCNDTPLEHEVRRELGKWFAKKRDPDEMVKMDAEGYYILFSNDEAGRQELHSCYQNFNEATLWDRCLLKMVPRPNGYILSELKRDFTTEKTNRKYTEHSQPSNPRILEQSLEKRQVSHKTTDSNAPKSVWPLSDKKIVVPKFSQSAQSQNSPHFTATPLGELVASPARTRTDDEMSVSSGPAQSDIPKDQICVECKATYFPSYNYRVKCSTCARQFHLKCCRGVHSSETGRASWHCQVCVRRGRSESVSNRPESQSASRGNPFGDHISKPQDAKNTARASESTTKVTAVPPLLRPEPPLSVQSGEKEKPLKSGNAENKSRCRTCGENIALEEPICTRCKEQSIPEEQKKRSISPMENDRRSAMINALPKGFRAIKRAVGWQGPSVAEPTRARSESLGGSSSNRVNNGRDATMGENGEARAPDSPPRARHAAREGDTDVQMGRGADQRPGPAPPYKINKTMNNLSWSLIVGMALREYPRRTATAYQIHRWITEHIEETDVNLRRDTAAYLAQGPAFIKGPRVDGHPSAHYWTLDSNFTSNFPKYRDVVERARLIQDLHQRNGPNPNHSPPADDKDRASARARNVSTNDQPPRPSVRQALEFVTRHRVTYDEYGRDIVPGTKNATENPWHKLPRRNTVTVKGVPFNLGDYVKLPLPAKPYHSSFEHVPPVEAIAQIEDLRVRDEGAGCAVLVQWFMNKEAADRFECRHRHNWPKSIDDTEAGFVRCALWDIITSDCLQEKLDPSTSKRVIFETHFMEVDTDQGKLFLKEKDAEWPWYGVAFENDIDKTIRLQGQNKISVHGRLTGYNGLRKTPGDPTWEEWLHKAFPEDYPSKQTNRLSRREEAPRGKSKVTESSTAKACEDTTIRASEGSTFKTSDDSTSKTSDDTIVVAKDGVKDVEKVTSSRNKEVTMTEAGQDSELLDAPPEENQLTVTPSEIPLVEQLFTPPPQLPPNQPESPNAIPDLDIEMVPAPPAERVHTSINELLKQAIEEQRESERASKQTYSSIPEPLQESARRKTAEKLAPEKAPEKSAQRLVATSAARKSAPVPEKAPQAHNLAIQPAPKKPAQKSAATSAARKSASVTGKSPETYKPTTQPAPAKSTQNVVATKAARKRAPSLEKAPETQQPAMELSPKRLTQREVTTKAAHERVSSLEKAPKAPQTAIESAPEKLTQRCAAVASIPARKRAPSPDNTPEAHRPATEPTPQTDRVQSVAGPSKTSTNSVPASQSGRFSATVAPDIIKTTNPATSQGRIDIIAVLNAEFDKQPFNVKNLFAVQPELQPSAVLFDKEAKIKEIEKRPSRKACFTKRLAHARRERPEDKVHNELERPLPSTYKQPASYEGERPRRAGALSFDESYWANDTEMLDSFSSSQDTEPFETLEELLDLPKERLPILYENRHLAYRDGTMANGRLPRAKEIWKVGRNVPGELK